MQKVFLFLIPLWLGLLRTQVSAQNGLNNVNHFAGSSDNTGSPVNQPGTEVLASSVGAGISFEAGGSFEHVGQFYVAKDGIWNGANTLGADLAGTDYFGYAPKGIGSYQAYQGKGIKGASSSNGGTGIGTPVFGHLQLNSTGEFPVNGGMQIVHSLRFNANGPGQENIITTPNATTAKAKQVVSFAADVVIDGADEANYIDGFVRVTNPTGAFTLPIGHRQELTSSFRPLTVNYSIQGSITARYLPDLQHSAAALGEGVNDVYPIGNWQIDAPAGTNVTISLPNLMLPSDASTALRLVGWNGNAWIDLSGKSTAGACLGEGCALTGTLTASITDLAIGLSGRRFVGEDSPNLTVWPNPTRGKLTLRLATDEPIQGIRILDLTGQPLNFSSATSSVVDATVLPAGSYIVEAQTATGQALRRRFIKQ